MATAPKPGANRRAHEARKYYRITVRGQTLELTSSLTLQERFLIRNMTGGLSLESMFRSPGRDLLVILWWLARRANGEPTLALDAVDDELVGLTEDDYEFEVVDDDDGATDDPEGSGPA